MQGATAEMVKQLLQKRETAASAGLCAGFRSGLPGGSTGSTWCNWTGLSSPPAGSAPRLLQNPILASCQAPHTERSAFTEVLDSISLIPPGRARRQAPCSL